MRWHEASIPVPSRFMAHDEFEVELTANDYWYPAHEADAANDMRCLGVLIRVEDDAHSASPRTNCLALPPGLDPLIWGESVAVPGGAPIYRVPAVAD